MMKVIRKYWEDPVWSNVIAGMILPVIGALSMLIISWVNEVPFKEVIFNVWGFLGSSTSVSNLSIITAIVLIGILLFIIFRLRYSKLTSEVLIDSSKLLNNLGIQHNQEALDCSKVDTNLEHGTKQVATSENEGTGDLPIINEIDTWFFFQRVSSAFPGVRGLQWFYDPAVAVDRLKILFKEPLNFKVGHYEPGFSQNPIWWFRESSSSDIRSFESLSDTKVLINIDELEIDKIAVYHGSGYYQDFVYLEAKGEPEVGVYDVSEEDKIREVNKFGYSSEEYGIFNGVAFKRSEFDDGATVIDGKVIETAGAKARCRYLSKYNILIAANSSPYNSTSFEHLSEEYFNKILIGEANLEDMLPQMLKLPKHRW